MKPQTEKRSLWKIALRVFPLAALLLPFVAGAQTGGSTGSTGGANQYSTPLPVPGWSLTYIPVTADPITQRPMLPYVDLVKQLEYLIRVRGNPGTYNLQLDLRTLPRHDQFEDALVLTNFPTQAIADYNVYATKQDGEPAVIYHGATLWYMLQAPSGRITATVDNSSFNKPILQPYISVWQGTNVSQLAFVAENRVPLTNSVNPYSFPDQFTFTVKSGNTYYLRLDAADKDGEYRLTCQYLPDAPNDLVRNAIALPLAPKQYDNGARYTNTVHGNNYGSGTEPGEPLDMQNTVWFKFQSPATGYVDASAFNGSNYQAYLVTGPAGAQTPAILSRQTLPNYVNQGQWCYLALGGPYQGEFDLSTAVTVVPSNDYQTNAIVLNHSYQSPIYDYYATANEPDDFPVPGVHNSIWWEIDPPTTGTFSLRSMGNVFNEQMWRLVKLDPVTHQTTTPVQPLSRTPGLVTWNVSANTSYDVWFGALDSEIGEGVLSFEMWPNPTNDLFTSPIDITSRTNIPYSNGTVIRYSLDGHDNGTTQSGEPVTNAVWYRWTSPGNGHLDAEISSAVPTFLVGQIGNTISSFTTIPNPSLVTNAEVVTMAVGGNYDMYTLSCDFRTTPSNDEATNALPIVLGDYYTCYTRYANLNPDDGSGASDIWFTYDPAQFAGPVEIRVNPDRNGRPVTLYLTQGGQSIGAHTFSNRGEDPWTLTIQTNGIVTIRAVSTYADEDFDLIMTYQAINDNFADRMNLTLAPRSWNVSTPMDAVTMADYYRRVVVNNRNATMESGEVGPNTLQRAPVSGKSLWWQFATPNVPGTLSIKTSPGGIRLSYMLTTKGSLPTAPKDYLAYNRAEDSQAVILNSVPNTTYQLRVDTELGYEDKLMDFSIVMIPFPTNDFMQKPQELPIQETTTTSTYKNKYTLAENYYQTAVASSIYGGTRQAIGNTLDGQIVETSAIFAWYNTGLSDFPYGQTIWYHLKSPDLRSYTVTTAGTTFEPFVAISDGFPAQTAMHYLSEGSQVILDPAKDYYLLVDALTPYAQWLNDYGREPTVGPVNAEYQAFDINRAGQDSIAGALNLRLYTAEQSPNNLFELASTITMAPTFLPGTNAACGNYISGFHGYGIGDNSTATADQAPYDQFPNGAGKTLWWKVQAPRSDFIGFDLSDSSCPVVTRVFNDNSRSNWVTYTGSKFQILAQAGHTYFIGVDSTAGNQGIIVVAATQLAAAPINDNFVNAREITSAVTCGTMDHATLEQGESTEGQGSIWYQWHNYANTPQDVAFQLLAGNSKLMSLYRGDFSSVSSMIPAQIDAQSIAYTAQAGETIALRVYDLSYPVTGQIQITMQTGTNYYLGMLDVTPSTTFTNSLLVHARSTSTAQPTFFFSANGPAGLGSPIFQGNLILTNSAHMEFLALFPDGTMYNLSRDYTLVPNVRLTDSQVFKGLLEVSLSNAPAGTIALFAKGDGNGNPPTMTPSLPFAGLTLDVSADVQVLVNAPGYNPFTIEGHYTNTVADVLVTPLGNEQLSLSTPTPQATLTVFQGGNSITYLTNQISITADYPVLDVIASRPGWQSVSNHIDLSTNYVMSLLPLSVTTNTAAANRLSVTITNPNPASYIWYTLSTPDGQSATGRATNSFLLDAAYSFALSAFAASPAMSSRGPSTNIAFTATLLEPAIVQNPDGTVIVQDLNTNAQSSLVVNDVPLGTAYWAMPYDGEGTIWAYAKSPVANNSATNSLTVTYAPYVSVTPPTATFYTNVTVHISSALGSHLAIGVDQEGTHQDIYCVTRQTDITLDRPTTLTVNAERYGTVQVSSTNIFYAKVLPPTAELPPPQNGAYPILTPIVLSSPTPGAAFKYAIDTSAFSASSGFAYLEDGSHYYRFIASRPYWQDSDEVDMTLNGYTPDVSLANYVSPYWTILPGITTFVYATNAALVSTPFVQFINQVWLDGGSPGDFIPLSSPVTNLLVWHRVVKVESDGVNPTSVIDGAPQGTFISASYFDFRVDDPDPRLQVGPGSGDILFYKPVWLLGSSSNLVLQAVGNAVAYDLTPVRQGNRWLIPGNLAGQDHLTLRYRNSGGGNWQSFVMQFQTLMPEQFYLATNSAWDIIVKLDPGYSGQPVGAYYDTNNVSLPITAPLPNPITISNLLGSFEYDTHATNGAYWINSKYVITNWSGINLYQNLPVVPLSQ